MQYSVSSYLSLPQKPGVYRFLDIQGTILYVGKAKNLKNRVSSYFQSPDTLLGKTRILVRQVATIDITIVESEIESLLLEAALIKKHQPKYNIRLTDGKAYPLIRITKKSVYPCVTTARRPDDMASEYFGPYPSAGSVRLVLKTIRRIFPYQSVVNHPKHICLYHHLGLCPCPPLFTTQEQKNEYKKTIHHVIDFLNGNTRKVRKDLEKERDVYAHDEKYEQAARLQKQIDAIHCITQPVHTPFEYQTNPNLRIDLRMRELKDLQEVLKNHGMTIELPRRIECYDNSNIQGTNPTSSMVVLTSGEIDTSQYRKFKVRGVKGPNDFDTMKEVLQRRMKHEEWPFPQLIVVDGGKGQVTSALEVLNQSNSLPYLGELQGEVGSGQVEKKSNIPVIGLAKRFETIITSDLQEIYLSKHSPALQLMMRIRNEAHRFAITYHRKLRSKKMTI